MPSHSGDEQSLHVLEVPSVNSNQGGVVHTLADIYYSSLARNNAITFGDSLATALVINDFDENTGVLKSDSFAVIERKVVYLLMDNSYEWISWCSCNSKQMSEMSTLDTSISVPLATLTSQIEKCAHMDVAKRIFERYDKFHDINPSGILSSHEAEDHECSTPCSVSIDSIGFIWPTVQIHVVGQVEKVQSKEVLKFIDRVCIEDSKTRQLLKRYGKAKNTKQLITKEKEEMLKTLKINFSTLFNFLEEIDDGTNSCPKIYQNFILSLASNSPVCSYIHVNDTVSTLLKDICSGINLQQNPIRWKLLHEELPLLYQLISETTTKPSMSMTSLLSDLWQLAVAPFDTNIETSDSELPLQPDELSFFPSLNKYRERGVFQGDRFRSKTSCRKLYPGHPSLLPGIFTLYCPHGICYGFQVMESNESPNVPFTIFRTRFKTAPKIIIYDNACSLHQYCLNRDPFFFKNTEFYIDRLHWDNHVGCSIAYSLSFNPKWNHLNSQVNEQGNAGLKRIKDMLSYMTAENFMAHCTFYLYNKNALKLSI